MEQSSSTHNPKHFADAPVGILLMLLSAGMGAASMLLNAIATALWEALATSQLGNDHASGYVQQPSLVSPSTIVIALLGYCVFAFCVGAGIAASRQWALRSGVVIFALMATNAVTAPLGIAGAVYCVYRVGLIGKVNEPTVP